MICCRSPFRISYFGGGTDKPEYFHEYGGAVISATINKYSYVYVKDCPQFYKHKNDIITLHIDRTQTISEIEHPLIRNVLKYYKKENQRIFHDGDLPGGSGLGSSSAFACALVLAYESLAGKYVTKRDIANIAIELERGKDWCDEPGGWQDQITSAFGGLNVISFKNTYIVEPLVIDQEALQSWTMLFYTGKQRNAFEIAKSVSIENNISKLRDIARISDKAFSAIKSSNWTDVGHLMHESWMLKKSMSSMISPDWADDLYAGARKAGALGGKLLGEGGGGFLMLFCDPKLQQKVTNALEYPRVNFKFESEGTRVIAHV
jgi:D-glycero-alpha-D-manno-heptose-7-phosphate kinase